jgi:prevent-host-death family protein
MERGAIFVETVAGVRDLKNKLSHYLREVKKDRSIVITERGKIVATLVPRKSTQTSRSLKNLPGARHKGKRIEGSTTFAMVLKVLPVAPPVAGCCS